MRKWRMHITQMVSQCDYLKVCPRERAVGTREGGIGLAKRISPLLRYPCWPVTCAHALALRSRWQEVLSLLVVLISLGVPVYAQDTTGETAPVPVLASPPPSSQERLLSPVPTQFDWIQREVRPNPLLEGLLALQDRSSRLFMSASLAEEYSDNFSQGGRGVGGVSSGGGGGVGGGDGREEFRTILSIGTVYRVDSGQSFLSLSNSLSANYQARSGESDIGFANLSLNVGHQMPRLSLALSESFVRDDDAGQNVDSELRRGRRTFLQNRISPQFRYTFNRLTSMAFAYTNAIVLSEGGVNADNSISHTFATSVQHRFSRLMTGNASYSYSTSNSDGGADTQSHRAAIDFGYLVDRRTSLIFQLLGLITDRSNGGENSLSYGATVGLRQQFTEFLGAFFSVGATVFDREGREPRVFVTWQASLDGTLPISRRTSLTLTSQQNIGDTAGTVDSVGIVLRQAVTLSLNHAFTQALLTTLFVNFTRTEQLEGGTVGTSESTQGRNDSFWRAGAQASYALSRVVSLSLMYVYQRRDSTLADGDFDENRVTLTVSSGFSLF